MSNRVRKFIPRAPRYVLRSSDKHVVRYLSEKDRIPIANRTTMLNLSESGMAIEVDLIHCPHVGDRLMVELTVPGGDQIAWWARVVRTHIRKPNWWSTQADQEPETVVVALHFDALPKGHVRAIRAGLNERFLEELRERRARQWLYVRSAAIQNTWKIVAVALTLITVVTVLYLLSRPTPNYDPAKGTGWGERFQFFDFQKDSD